MLPVLPVLRMSSPPTCVASAVIAGEPRQSHRLAHERPNVENVPPGVGQDRLNFLNVPSAELVIHTP
jgi:hypothetical protein